MKKTVLAAAIMLLALAVAASLLLGSLQPAVDESVRTPTEPLPDAPVYLGVTYCGDNVTEAKMLIDKVKTYTNLFVLQSGNLQKDLAATNSICRYAVDSGLHIMAYFSAVPTYRQYISGFLANEAVWGSNLLGIYFDDEPGGKMLDAQDLNFYNQRTGDIIRKMPSRLEVTAPDGTRTTYVGSGAVEVRADNYSAAYTPDGAVELTLNSKSVNRVVYQFEPNGTVYLLDERSNITSEVTDTAALPKVDSYTQVMAKKPFQNYSDTAEIYVGTIRNSTGWLHSQTTVKAVTSDYALYWYTYKGGYDVVLAELGWNHTTAQDIALARGAADMQSKEWGAIVTWKYTYPERVNFPERQFGPYIGSGEETYKQLRSAYLAGAKYLIVFNYPTYPADNPYGVLQEEHFSALQRLWTDTITNQSVANGAEGAKAALVLPENYGWGMRNQNDTIWGIWQPGDKAPQVWATLQKAIAAKGLNLDIVYNDPAFPVSGRYLDVYGWAD